MWVSTYLNRHFVMTIYLFYGGWEAESQNYIFYKHSSVNIRLWLNCYKNNPFWVFGLSFWIHMGSLKFWNYKRLFWKFTTHGQWCETFKPYFNQLLLLTSKIEINAEHVFAVGRRTGAEPLLRTLHWLPVPQRVTFKSLLYVYKALNEQAPLYIAELFPYYTPARPLRSSTDFSRLVVPKFNSVAGERRFAVAAAKAWNCLPECIRTAYSTNVFKKSLKTHLFWLDFVVNAYKLFCKWPGKRYDALAKSVLNTCCMMYVLYLSTATATI